MYTKNAPKKSNYHSYQNNFKPSFVPFKKTSDFVTPLMTHSGFYLKTSLLSKTQQKKQNIESVETLMNISVNIGTKKDKVKKLINLEAIKDFEKLVEEGKASLEDKPKKEYDYVKVEKYIVTFFENNLLVKVKTCRTVEYAKKVMNDFLNQYKKIEKPLTTEELKVFHHETNNSNLVPLTAA